jgi:hypothetical protein
VLLKPLGHLSARRAILIRVAEPPAAQRIARRPQDFLSGLLHSIYEIEQGVFGAGKRILTQPGAESHTYSPRKIAEEKSAFEAGGFA